MSERSATVTVRLPAADYDEVHRVARESGRSVAEWLRELLRRELAKKSRADR